MKKYFLILIALCFIALPKVVKSQPWGSGMNGVLIPNNYAISSGEFFASGKMLMPWECGYKFDDVGIELMNRENNIFDPTSGYAMLHIYCNSEINVSVYAPKIYSTTAVSLFQLYSDRDTDDVYWRAKEILRDYYHITSKVVTDTITEGSIYIGNSENPKEKRAVISGGKIIISFDTQSCILTVTVHDLHVKCELNQESTFTFPEPKLK